MPMRAPVICGCGRVKAGGACPACKTRLPDRRPTAAQRGYDGAWRKARAEFLSLPENHYCACGCGRKADTVDHIRPHRGDPFLFWDRFNWQALAGSPCHSAVKQRQERRHV